MTNEYTAQDKLNAAIFYVLTGNSVQTSQLCGVPDRTVREWTQQEWWADVLEEARNYHNLEIESLYLSIQKKAAEELKQRVEKGDLKVFANGFEKTVPVTAKDLSVILGITTEKLALMRGQATSRVERVSVDKSLQRISEKLKEVGNG
jgi:hypothetical protein